MGPLTNMYSGRRRKAAALRGIIREQEDTAAADRELLLAGGVSGSERIDLAVEGVMEETWEHPGARFLLGRSNDKFGWASQWADLPVKGDAKLRLG